MTNRQAQEALSYAIKAGRKAIVRRAQYAGESWVVEMDGRAYGSIFHIRDALKTR